MADNCQEEDFIDKDFTEEDSDFEYPKERDNTEVKETADVEESHSSTNDQLPPVVVLRKLVDSDIICNRQVAARKVAETLRKVAHDEVEVHGIVSVICKLSDDSEGVVRAELVEHIPSIAMFCNLYTADLDFVIKQQLVPITVKLTEDPQLQVRKLAQESLLVLFKNNLVDSSLANEWICPFVALQATLGSNEDRRTEAVTLMCKLVHYVDSSVVTKCFLEPFSTLCSDPSLSIRKICASSFGEFCRVVGTESTENLLLPKFIALCEDDQRNVRKACSESFVDISLTLNSEDHRKTLINAYISLLCDHSRWVRCYAYQYIGMLIASRGKAGAHYRETGQWDLSFSSSSDSSSDEATTPTREIASSPDVSSDDDNGDGVPKFKGNNPVNIVQQMEKRHVSAAVPLKVTSKDGHLHLHLDNESIYNNFQFWRLPIPDVEVDVDIEDGCATNIHIKTKTQDAQTNQICSSDFSVKISTKVCDQKSKFVNADGLQPVQKRENVEMHVLTSCINTVTSSPSTSDVVLPQNVRVVHSSFNEANTKLGDSTLTELTHSHHYMHSPISNRVCDLYDDFPTQTSEEEYRSPYDQDVVPPELLDKYVNMIEPMLASDVDSTITSFCAYYLPAVTYTLGRENWACLKKVYRTLATDVQWKVRKIIASSLFVLARILGSDISSTDLYFVFRFLLKDLDEIRIELLSHLSDFIKHVTRETRKNILPEIKSFLKVDNDRNWRFRCILAEQLHNIVKFYNASEINEHITPVVMHLLKDKVCSVRLEAVKAMTNILIRMPRKEYCSLLIDLDENFRKSSCWRWRQMYVYLIQELEHHHIPPKEFASDVGSSILALAKDNVFNVRSSLEKFISEKMHDENYSALAEKHEKLFLEAVDLLGVQRKISQVRHQ